MRRVVHWLLLPAFVSLGAVSPYAASASAQPPPTGKPETPPGYEQPTAPEAQPQGQPQQQPQQGRSYQAQPYRVQPGAQLGHAPSPPPPGLIEEEAELRARLGELSLGPPIVTLSIGGGVALIGGYLFLVAVAADSSCTGAGCEDFSGAATFFGIGALVGAGVAVAGLVWLLNRIADRAPYRDRYRELQELRQVRGWSFQGTRLVARF